MYFDATNILSCESLIMAEAGSDIEETWLTVFVVHDGPQELDDVVVVSQLRGEEVDFGGHLEGVVLAVPSWTM